jgi:Zn-dependent M28 family amino/carboxypeptidase
MDSGAAAVIIEETPQWRGFWDRFASRKVSYTSFLGGTGNVSTAMIIVSTAAADSLSKVAEGTQIEIGGKLDEPKTRQTWNSVGMIRGRDERLSSEVILLSAHMDHLGFRENEPGEDKIFNGADDDASGCVAVIELARILANGKRPKRSVYFAFFGSEEAGGFGSRFFVNNLPFAKEKLVANLQFEMLGRPDAAVGKDELWLTGYDRSNLGIELANHGAKLVNDPHPEQNFFQRSDNYALARQGIIAHTVSSYGLHKDYHRASDEIKTIDFEYMTNAINSMVKPVKWLVNSDFKPIWYEGKRP